MTEQNRLAGSKTAAFPQLNTGYPAEVNYLWQINKRTSFARALRSLIGIEDTLVQVTCGVAYVSSIGAEMFSRCLLSMPCDVTVVVGNERTSSAQALIVLLRAGVRIVVADPGSTKAIFHPKAYFVQHRSSAYVVAGSPNMTGRGLRANIEFGCIVKHDMQTLAGRAGFSSGLDPFRQLLARHPEHFIPIDRKISYEDLLDQFPGKLGLERPQITRLTHRPDNR